VNEEHDETGKIAASDIELEQFQVWYHLPLSLTSMPAGISDCWSHKQMPDKNASPAQRAYFHKPVSDALWGSDTSSDIFERFTRRGLGSLEFSAERRNVKEPNQDQEDEPAFPTFFGSRFHGHVTSAEIRITKPQTRDDNPINLSENSPALAIFVLGVTFTAVTRFWDIPLPDDLDTTTTIPDDNETLTLADAQNALEWVRRIFPRWWTKRGLSGDTLTQVTVPTCKDFPAERQLDKNGEPTTDLLPWIKELLGAFCPNGNTITHFGDDRGYMTSAIHVKEHPSIDQEIKGGPAWHTLARLKDSDKFRLAEADIAGSGYPYGASFLKRLRDDYFYERHAPDPKTDTGNSTLYMMSHHHLCALGCGDYYRDHIHQHAEEYYRHMQFLAVFEYFSLLQFSQRLTGLINQQLESSDAFGKELLTIRGDFLRFTHLHHFSNVSLQLQPREMFAKLYKTMGIEELFREVEQEIADAAEFHAMEEAQKSSKRSERLNNLVAFGVPISLISGFAGMNLLVGDLAPEIEQLGPPPDKSGLPIGLDVQLFQLAFISFLVLAVWAGAMAFFQPKIETRGVSQWAVMLALAVASGAVAAGIWAL